jgi:hypothetical protein
MHTALMHRAVNCAKYQKRILTNAQNGNPYIQFSFDDNPFFAKLISVTNQPFTFTLNVDVLAFPKKDGTYNELDAQNDCFTVGIEWLSYIAQDDYFLGKLAVRDYSMLGLSGYTDDNAAGFRFTVEFIIPNPIDLCHYLDNFSEDFIPEEQEDKQIDVKDPNPQSEINNLELRPILLPTKK